MISVAEAKKHIKQLSAPLQPILMELTNAVGYYLAEPIFAKADIPAFNQAAMDGYAFNLTSHSYPEKYSVIDSIMAGANVAIEVKQQQCVRIFTGAAVPDSANTVIMQEKIALNNQQVTILDEAIFVGKNIRLKGSELKAGELLLEKNSFLNAASIGLLASAGITHIVVYPKPRVAIITTGNELQKPGIELQKGQVYEANSFALKAALTQLHLSTALHVQVSDNLIETTKAIEAALLVADIILITGGISVGEYDFVKEATKNCKITQVFHKINQKPGKPLFYGIKNQQQIFGIPGNSAAVLTCFYEYVLIAINLFIGNKNAELNCIHRPLKDSYNKKPGIAHFLKGHYNETGVQILGAQESYRLSTFASANCFVYLPEESTTIHQHELVEVHLIPLS